MLPAYKTEATAIDAIEPGEFAPLAALQNTFRFWWVVFVFTVAGGVAGMGFHRMNPPVYEAQALFPASIDFVATGPLTQYEEDVALNKIFDIVYSSSLREMVAAEAQAAGIDVSAQDLKEMAFIERKVSTWILRVRHPDLITAEKITAIWMEQGHAVLLESYAHAIQARQLGQYVLGLENCLAKYVVVEPAHGLCDRYRFADIQADLQQAGEALFRERQASRGLFYGLTLGPPEFAGVSSAPVLYGRNRLVLAGSLIGLIAGVILNQSGFPARWLRKR